MRLGISTWSLPWAIGVPGFPPERPLDPVGLMDRAVRLGVGAVQFADNLPLERAEPAVIDAVARSAAEHDIAIEIGVRGIGPGLRDGLLLARRFGAGFVRLVVDRASDRPTPEEVVERLSVWEPEFRAAGVRVAIENHDRFSCSDVVAVVDRLGDWVGICLDTVNSLGALEAPDLVVGTLAPLAINLHLKDFVISRPAHGLGFEVTGAPVGAGLLDVAGVVETVAGYQQTDSAIIELWTPPQATLAETIMVEQDWLRQSVGYLAGLPAFS